MHLAESTDDKMSIKDLIDIVNEERVHVCGFLRLLNCLSPDEMESYKQGATEVDEIIENAASEQSSQQYGKNRQEDLHCCRNAASAEHAGRHHDDEQYDDGRSGEFE